MRRAAGPKETPHPSSSTPPPSPTPPLSAVIAAFRVFDTDGSGTLTSEELKAIFTRQVGSTPSLLTADQVDALIDRFDENKDGVFNIDEFSRAMASLQGDSPLDLLQAHVAAPVDEGFDDLIPSGAGCKISKTEERAMSVIQLKAVVEHIKRRCTKEAWVNYAKHALLPEKVSLYECCAYVIKPATQAKQTSYVELVSTGAQRPTIFCSHWWGEPVVDFVDCIEQHAEDHEYAEHESTSRPEKPWATYWICACTQPSLSLPAACLAALFALPGGGSAVASLHLAANRCEQPVEAGRGDCRESGPDLLR